MTWQIIVSAMTGGLAGAFAAHWLVIWRDGAGRRLAFRNLIAILKADLGDIPDASYKQIHALYDESRRDVLVESAKIEADVLRCRRGKLSAARADYRDMKSHQDKQLLEIMAYQREHGFEPPVPPEVNRGDLKSKMLSLLQTMYDLAA